MARSNPSVFPWLSRHDIGKHEGILLVLWASLNTFFLLHRGIYLEGESAKYIYQGQLLLTRGAPESANFWLYFIQIALIACCIRLKLSFYCVILIQLLLNLIATACFFKTLQYLFQKKNIAFIGTFLLLANYFYQEFNTFLYTESLFYSFTLIFSCYLFRIRELTIKKTSYILGMLAIICLTRPTGLLYIPPAFLYLLIFFFKIIPRSRKIVTGLTLAIVFLILLNLALGSGGELDLMLPFRDQNIICGVPSLPHSGTVDNPGEANSLIGLTRYIMQNFPTVFRLALLRTRAFFGLYRDYFSTGHKLQLIVFFYPIYLMAMVSAGWWIKNRPSPFCYFAAIIGLTWLTVMLTCDDWHNRFFLGISPFVILLAMPVFLRRIRRP